MILDFDLELSALISPNRLIRMIDHERARRRNGIAWNVRTAIHYTKRPNAPLPRAWITITRHAPRPLDEDNLAGSAKLLLDVLQPTSSRHPAGLGFIASDAPACLTLAMQQKPCPAKKAHVNVRISSEAPNAG